MHYLKLKKPLAFFDLEATGINVVTDRIVEICISKAMPDGKLITKTVRLNPERSIPMEATMIHGISDEDVKDCPTFKKEARNLEQMLEGCDLAGYNLLKFDVPMLVEEFLRADINFDTSNRHIVDAQRIFHLMEPRTLSAAFKFYCGKEMEELGGQAHSAETDVLATYHVLNEQVRRYENQVMKDPKGKEYVPIENNVEKLHQLSAGNTIDFAGRLAYNQKQEPIFTFGKHKDRTVAEVLEKEPQYYDWMMKSEFPMDTKRKLTELRLNIFKKF